MRRLGAALMVTALLSSACASSPSPEATASPSTSATFVTESRQPFVTLSLSPSPAGPVSHIVVVVMENKEFDAVIGSPSAPYLNDLASRSVLLTSSFGVTHPSLPNYLALLGGSTFGIDSDCTRCSASGPSLAGQLDHAGIG